MAEEWVALLKGGSTDALETLIEHWRPGAEAYAYRFLHDHRAAEDAVLEAFSRIWTVRGDLDERCSFSAFLFTVVRRICIDELRRQKRFPALPGELPDPPAASAEAEYLAQWERLRRLRLLAELDGTDRELLLAFSLDGKSTRQIARETGLSDGAVRVRLHRIRRKLRKGMNDDA